MNNLGLSEEEMKRIIDGARTAFGSPYNNEYPAGALGSVEPPRQPIKQRGKIKHAPKPLRR